MPTAKGRVLLEGLDPSVLNPIESLEKSELLNDSERKRVRSTSDAALERALANGANIVEAHEIPGAYQEAEGLHPALFVNGDVSCLDRPCVAIVGTRSASTYGKAVAEKFGEAFARAGVTVVSGGALGIDAAAHKGALNAGGKTVAVLAGGVDTIYPAVHAGLFNTIRQNGCLISQFAVGTRPDSFRFLLRNGVIAALSHAVLVVEAPIRSGALRTAHDAAELGREVFVVPANVDNLNFAGSFGLIRDGATLVVNPDQILESMGIQPIESPTPAPESSDLGTLILSVLTVEPIAVEFIVERTGKSPSDILSELTMLELEGRVIRDAGGYAKRP